MPSQQSTRSSSHKTMSSLGLASVALVALSSCSVEGFSPVSNAALAPPKTQSTVVVTSASYGRDRSTHLKMSSDAQDEVAKLKEMAAKAREEAAALAKELGYEDEDLGTKGASGSSTAAPPKPSKTTEEVAASIRAIDFNSGSASDQVSALDALRSEGSLSLYKSATAEAGSGDLRSYPCSLGMLENRAGLTSEKLGIGEEEVSLDDFKYGTLWITGGCTVAGIASLALLPENIGATLCYFLALIPILWLAVGSTVPAAIANLILLVKGNDDGGVDRTDRVCRHEAAHFLCGYLCGLPVASYATADDSDVPRVEFHYSADGAATANRELTMDEVNALTVVALSGAVSEAMAFGKAQGGAGNADLTELQNIFRKSEQFLGAEKQQDMTRWGALTAYRLLNSNSKQLNALVEAFRQKKSVADCVAIIEEKA
ncbi:unnamed protein product [Pseudo-nitzschia multistriata]|uniref:Peptidase M41 domain-containing protein n=1 Tax=Pseudo-nitzschia multistriata TaxID=183589 RepID=A0A448YW50_9STRA|nr:unnamed protein product [Pseudo-nitzschia multistriata]